MYCCWSSPAYVSDMSTKALREGSQIRFEGNQEEGKNQNMSLKLLEDSGGFWAPGESEGRMQTGDRGVSLGLSVAWFRGFPALVPFKQAEWPWTMTFPLTPPSCSISMFSLEKQTQALSPESLTLSQVSPPCIWPTASALSPTHSSSFLLRWLLQPPEIFMASSHASVILSTLEQS